jgi:hypothetical protein
MLKHTTSVLRRRAAAGVVIALCAGAGVGIGSQGEAAQPDRGQERTRERDGASPDASPLRKAARDRVRDELRMRIQRGQEALAMLDQGSTYEEVRAKFPEIGRMRGESGGQPGDDRGPSAGPGWSEFGEGWGGRGAPAPSREMTPEDKAVMRELLQTASPRLSAMLADLESRDAAEADKRYRKAFERMHVLIDLRKRDPRGAELRVAEVTTMRDVVSAVKQFQEVRRAGGSSEALVEKRRALREAVAKRFDAQGAIQEHEHAQRVRDRERLIDEEVERVIARESREGKPGRP